jgi:DUF1365 family protein
MFYIDLGELDRLSRESVWWSTRRPAPVRFKRSDYLGDASTPLEVAVRREVTDKTGRAPSGPIRMLTHLRQFGYCFNPVTFYYCFDAVGERVEAIVAEITNTPWGERHTYVLGRDASVAERGHRYRMAKSFHVSPFMDMNHHYDWRFTEPGDTVSAHFENHREGELYFDATLTMRRTRWSSRAVARTVLRYPFMPARVTAAIYWQALRLWMKRVPFHPHPKHLPAREERDTP